MANGTTPHSDPEDMEGQYSEGNYGDAGASPEALKEDAGGDYTAGDYAEKTVPSADAELAIFEPDDCGCEPVDFVIDGNVAYFEVDAAALAEDSYVDVAVDALAVEDQFSSVTAAVVVLVG